MEVIFEDNHLLSALLGKHDEHLALIESQLDIVAAPRGNIIAITGAPEDCQSAKQVLDDLYDRLTQGLDVGPGDVEGAIRMALLPVNEGAGGKQLFTSAVRIDTRRRTVTPRSSAQAEYIQALQSRELTFGTGPAGTGKTYLAVACSVEALESEQVRRIILTRPAVEAGEKLGFLPGDLSQKVDPYLRPLFDALFDMLGFETVERLIEKNVIEIAPLAFMRGRTLNEAFIILDEAQNTSTEQMKMFLTRIGFGSTAVITGDITQCDLPRHQKSGLRHVIEVLEGVEGIGFTFYQAQDVVRHAMVQKIVTAYDSYERKESRTQDKS
ncbi:MAG: PhoH family protein [Thiomicrorhabdus sp.]|nr:PhoH family protein [Thiomicrorhabdus sp.]